MANFQNPSVTGLDSQSVTEACEGPPNRQSLSCPPASPSKHRPPASRDPSRLGAVGLLVPKRQALTREGKKNRLDSRAATGAASNRGAAPIICGIYPLNARLMAGRKHDKPCCDHRPRPTPCPVLICCQRLHAEGDEATRCGTDFETVHPRSLLDKPWLITSRVPSSVA